MRAFGRGVLRRCQLACRLGSVHRLIVWHPLCPVPGVIPSVFRLSQNYGSHPEKLVGGVPRESAFIAAGFFVAHSSFIAKIPFDPSVPPLAARHHRRTPTRCREGLGGACPGESASALTAVWGARGRQLSAVAVHGRGDGALDSVLDRGL